MSTPKISTAFVPALETAIREHQLTPVVRDHEHISLQLLSELRLDVADAGFVPTHLYLGGLHLISDNVSIVSVFVPNKDLSEVRGGFIGTLFGMDVILDHIAQSARLKSNMLAVLSLDMSNEATWATDEPVINIRRMSMRNSISSGVSDVK